MAQLYFLYFHAVFGKLWRNNRLDPPIWEILDPSLRLQQNEIKSRDVFTPIENEDGID